MIHSQSAIGTSPTAPPTATPAVVDHDVAPSELLVGRTAAAVVAMALL